MRRLLAMLVLPLSLCGPAAADTIFITNEKDNTVTVLDSETLKTIKTIPTGKRPRGIAITPDFKEVLVCVGDDDQARRHQHRDARNRAHGWAPGPIRSCSTSITRANGLRRQ